jgi:hypothetical protein
MTVTVADVVFLIHLLYYPVGSVTVISMAFRLVNRII